jgi:hypothetical protein
MTTLLPAQYRPSPTVLWATVPSPRKPPARYRPAVKDVPPATHLVLHGGESPPVGSGL